MVSVADMRTLPQATPALDVACALGESIVWCDRSRALWWTDIECRRIWRHGLDAGGSQWWSTPGRVGSLALCASGRLLLGMEDALFLASPDVHAPASALACERLCDVPLEGPAMRINDGRVDRSGNFVFGTMNGDQARARTGRFYQYSTRHGLRGLDLEPVAIANGICFELDGSAMYYCDSLQRKIMRARYDADAARVSAPSLFAETAGPGEPDGAIVDAAGHVWSAQWGAARLTCHLPTGSIAGTLPLAASQPTCIAFGDDDLGTMFITSARTGLDDVQLHAHPAAGGVFAARVDGVRGPAEARFAGA